VTLYLWISAAMPFEGMTVMLLMNAIQQAPDKVTAPKAATAGLKTVIEGLLTKDPASRLTLNKLRLDDWLTFGGKQPLPQQKLELIELTPEEIELAFSNRQAIAYQSAAGPSALGKASGYIPDWKREGLNTIRKVSNQAEATLYQAISSDSNLAHHVPVIYSVSETTPTAEEAARAIAIDGEKQFEVRMQDLAAGMTRPCAMGIVMGCRTIIAADPASQGTLRALDEATSTSSMGFRIDAARTVVEDGTLDALPLPEGKALETLKEEDDVVKALATFFRHDSGVCKTALLKLEDLAKALERSAFFAKHVLLRSTLLLLFDDDDRTKVELRMINFGFSYALPEGQTTMHTEAWGGSADSHEDGYMTGVRSLVRMMKALHGELEILV
jgi:hypothetical protein